MKIIKHKEDLPTPCKTCRKLRQTVRIPVYHCALKLHFPTAKNTCKREDMKCFEVFKKFLNDNGIFELYVKNIDRNFKYRKTSIKNPRLYIGLAFSWYSSCQGYSYWKQIADKWEIELKRNN